MTQIPAADQALLLVVIALCLGTCFVRVFWQLEQARARHRRPRQETGLRR